ncbi:acetyl-CoA carboxylase biotin carboxylase subunit [Candidatus Chrysopegis kryptomonas]|uniref:Acetyl-CoA carboxylase, biotin carboxylase subunit n=1 Tax=Candidatus Chryseopegocella kryptomonas TaxID=1633643 RepID=A0A0P1N0F0_9BACT|nr:acetyl-CoA carboxylase biotin carboxylase subunit [Candidatus Chrysopegis kryptomonas]CUT02009.1 acetyl-CoA carboxylase, biotin carboxylase subunit [Candidatus Chrysopegis kryptomonas]
MRILIANRGEIAVRIIRTCKVLGIETIAIYSKVDKDKPFVAMADYAECIGEANPAETYLNMEKIIDVAKKLKADAIHPGYGFLSENDEFAKLVQDNGLIFIGPSADAIKKMGDKLEAREIAKKVGVPIVPGSESPISDIQSAIEIARKIGFPILIKAAAGGGGKGMRIVHKEEDFESAIRGAKNEAKFAFGDDRVYIEKYVEEPHHIEVQILADKFGNVIALGERECSIQRRHQKVIEETPSPIVTAELREKLFESAIKIAKAVNYENAGTIEFIVDKNRNFYFLEMNTRLQVEHPVTEMVTGIDIVAEQIKIALGNKLSFSQEDIKPRGHAIECRIYAEDPFNNFLPSTGKITLMKEPTGPWVRVDAGIEEGNEITIHYDPMISKLVVWGKDRIEAIDRMKTALSEYKIFGVKTTIPFCLWVMNNEHFRQGKYDTHFIQNYFKPSELNEFDEISKDGKLTPEIAPAIAFAILNSVKKKQNQQVDKSSNAERKINRWKMKRYENFR